MSTQVQYRRGTAEQHASFIGAPGEITINTTTDEAHIHDGVTAGGHPLSKLSLVTALQLALATHEAETVSDGVHGMGSIASQTYQVGSWTPELKFGGANTGITYQNRAGRFTRVGRLITIDGFIYLSNKGTATGNAAIEGLPFVSGAGIPAFGVVGNLQNLTFTQNRTIAVANIPVNANYLQLNFEGSDQSISIANDTNFQNNTIVRFTATYSI